MGNGLGLIQPLFALPDRSLGSSSPLDIEGEDHPRPFRTSERYQRQPTPQTRRIHRGGHRPYRKAGPSVLFIRLRDTLTDEASVVGMDAIDNRFADQLIRRCGPRSGVPRRSGTQTARCWTIIASESSGTRETLLALLGATFGCLFGGSRPPRIRQTNRNRVGDTFRGRVRAIRSRIRNRTRSRSRRARAPLPERAPANEWRIVERPIDGR